MIVIDCDSRPARRGQKENALQSTELRPTRASKRGNRLWKQQFSFAWTAAILAVVHTHPNRTDAKPLREDLRLADRFGIPVFTITLRGMYVYDPYTKKTSRVQDGLDWLESSRRKQYLRPAGKE